MVCKVDPILISAYIEVSVIEEVVRREDPRWSALVRVVNLKVCSRLVFLHPD